MTKPTVEELLEQVATFIDAENIALSAQVRELREENERLRINVKPIEDEIHRLCAAAGVIADDYERLKQSLATAREEALEEAAKFMEARGQAYVDKWLDNEEMTDYAKAYGFNCLVHAKAIRALKPTTEAGGGETIPKCLECGVPVPRSATYCGVCEIL
jgi:predicted nuclease with TOPRIM domain